MCKHRLIFASISIAVLASAVFGWSQLRSAAADAGKADANASTAAASKADTKSAAGPVNRDTTLTGKQPAKDDTLILYYPNDPDTLNPITSNDSVSDEFFRLCYEYLAPRDFHDPDKFKPTLAESWEFNPDKLEYTIKLRKGVKWHPMKLPNGKELPATEFTARDVKFTFDCILNKNIEAGHYRSYYEDPDAKDESERYKIKVSLVPGDKYTVKIKWTQPYFLMEEYTLASAVIIPKHVFSVDENGEPISFDMSSSEFAKKFNNHWANTKACGSGPMMLKKWKKDEQLEFERNADYWGSPFYFSNAIYRCIPNSNTEMQQILQNQLDFGIVPEKDLWMQAKSHKNVQDGKAVLEKFYFPSYRYIGYNMKHPFLKDKNVRWALGHAVPVEDILAKVFYGLGLRVTGPFLYSSKSNDKSLEPLKYDLEKSRKLLDEAGWKDTNSDGVRDKMIGGERVDAKFDLMIYADSPTYLIIAEQVKENCRKIGVTAHITPAKWGLMLQRLQKKEFDACMLGWFLNWEQDPFQIWHGSLADVPNTSNSVGYKNPEVDRLIEKLRGTLDKEEQTKICHQIHKLIYDDQPYTFLFAEQRTAGRDARLGDLEFFPPAAVHESKGVDRWSSQEAGSVAALDLPRVSLTAPIATTSEVVGVLTINLSAALKSVDLLHPPSALHDSDADRSHDCGVSDNEVGPRQSSRLTSRRRWNNRGVGADERIARRDAPRPQAR